MNREPSPPGFLFKDAPEAEGPMPAAERPGGVGKSLLSVWVPLGGASIRLWLSSVGSLTPILPLPAGLPLSHARATREGHAGRGLEEG